MTGPLDPNRFTAPVADAAEHGYVWGRTWRSRPCGRCGCPWYAHAYRPGTPHEQRCGKTGFVACWTRRHQRGQVSIVSDVGNTSGSYRHCACRGFAAAPAPAAGRGWSA